MLVAFSRIPLLAYGNENRLWTSTFSVFLDNVYTPRRMIEHYYHAAYVDMPGRISLSYSWCRKEVKGGGDLVGPAYNLTHGMHLLNGNIRKT